MALNYFARVFPEKTYWRNIMQLLEEKIKTDGIAVNEDILKVDSFINHKVDPFLMKEIGKDFAHILQIRGLQKSSPLKAQVLLLPLPLRLRWGFRWLFSKSSHPKS